MRNVKVQSVWSGYVYLKKKMSLFKEVAVFNRSVDVAFSIICFKIAFGGIVKKLSFPGFLVMVLATTALALEL